MIPSDLVSDLLSYCAGVAGGARDTSVFSWLRAHKVTRVRSEELLEQLVTTGRLQRIERPVAGGEVVVRYLPADPATPPAPLPVSDAPPEEMAAPPAEEGEEEPVLLTGTPAEPCQQCALIRAELGVGLEEALQRTAELARERADLVRRHDDIRSALGLSAQVEWGSILDRARDLVGGNGDYREQLRAARDEAHRLADRLMVATGERDDLAATRDRVEDHRCALAQLVGLDGGAPWGHVLARVTQALGAAPTVSGDALRQYLLTAPDETWSRLARARAQLAEARALQERAASLQAAALASLDEPAPEPPEEAPELVPDPIPLGPTPPPSPPSGEVSREGTRPERILALFQARPGAEMRAEDVAAALGDRPHAWTVALSAMARDGRVERVGHGLYRLARRRAA